jgi:hypothetical protein
VNVMSSPVSTIDATASGEGRVPEPALVRKTLTLGPLSILFSNENQQFQIPLHTHHATVRLEYSFRGTAGFPILANTMDDVRRRLRSLVESPFLNTRNEGVLEAIFRGFEGWTSPAIQAFQGDWSLRAVELTVFGTRDDLGHDDGPATYRMEIS